MLAFSGVQGLIGTGKLAPESEAKAQQTFAVWGKGLNLAYRTGVKIALGTDSAVAPHKDANKELALMVSKGGMTPRDALIAATKGGPGPDGPFERDRHARSRQVRRSDRSRGRSAQPIRRQ